MDLVFDRLGKAAGIPRGQASVPKRGNHPLARLTFCISISFNELKKWTALDLFGAKKHAVKMTGKSESAQDKNNLLGTTFQGQKSYIAYYQ